jgi:hypothetical protein
VNRKFKFMNRKRVIMKNFKKWLSGSALGMGLLLGVSGTVLAQTPPQEVERIVVVAKRTQGGTVGDFMYFSLPAVICEYCNTNASLDALELIFIKIDWDEEILKNKKFCKRAAEDCGAWETRGGQTCITERGRDISSNCAIAVSREGVSGGGDCRQVSVKNAC